MNNYQKTKVIFINTNKEVENKIIKKLFFEGFEIFISDIHNNLENLITEEYENIIIFIYIEKNYKPVNLSPYIDLIFMKYDKKNVNIYILTKETQKEFKIKKIVEIMNISNDINKNVEIIKNIILREKSNERRKYVRASCKNKKNNHIKIIDKNKIYHGKIINISIKAVACVLENSNEISINKHFKNIIISIDNIETIVSGKVHDIYPGIKINNNNDLIVIIFDNIVNKFIDFIINEYIEK